ncbi:hypothetical protein BDZ89DRAFT_1086571, partial [Hymenopellis radicata]
NAAIDWKGTAKVTWSGIEMLLKRAEKCLDGTPFSTPSPRSMRWLLLFMYDVSDRSEDMRDMISQYRSASRLSTRTSAVGSKSQTNARMSLPKLKKVFQELEASTKDFHCAILSISQQHRLDSLPGSRVTRGECTPGTRVEIIQRLVEWAQKPSSESSASIYWLNGSAGMGKSTIAYSVSKILGASFFCSRQLADRYSRSFATALLQANLDSADSSSKQMKDLLVEPWQKSGSARLPDFPPYEVRGGWEFLSEAKVG